MKRLLALVLCLCFALGGCGEKPSTGHSEDYPSPAPAGTPAAEGAPAVSADFERLALRLADAPGQAFVDWAPRATDAFSGFTLATARELLLNTGGKNAVYSPANLYLALSMLAETADGESRAQLLKLLGWDGLESVRSAADSLAMSLYRDSETGKTLLANSLWLNEQIDFHEDTIDTLAEDYHASTFRAPMGEASTDAAVARWIDEQTSGLLADAAGALQTKPETLLMLISTLYFKGTWRDQFDETATREDVFTSAKGDEQRIGFMHKIENGDYIRGGLAVDFIDEAGGESGVDYGFTIACLGFRGGSGVMYFLLPDEGVSLDSLLEAAATNFLAVTQMCEFPYGEIHWSVPKFDAGSDLDLIPTLQALGVTDVFDRYAADFSPLTDLSAFVSQAKHAARVTVDEEGCEAAAFTAIDVSELAAPPDDLPVVEMNLNRPFGFLITGADGLPLFMGVVNTME